MGRSGRPRDVPRLLEPLSLRGVRRVGDSRVVLGSLYRGWRWGGGGAPRGVVIVNSGEAARTSLGYCVAGADIVVHPGWGRAVGHRAIHVRNLEASFFAGDDGAVAGLNRRSEHQSETLLVLNLAKFAENFRVWDSRGWTWVGFNPTPQKQQRNGFSGEGTKCRADPDAGRPQTLSRSDRQGASIPARRDRGQGVRGERGGDGGHEQLLGTTVR